jgi:hypothetical protein
MSRRRQAGRARNEWEQEYGRLGMVDRREGGFGARQMHHCWLRYAGRGQGGRHRVTDARCSWESIPSCPKFRREVIETRQSSLRSGRCWRGNSKT